MLHVTHARVLTSFSLGPHKSTHPWIPFTMHRSVGAYDGVGSGDERHLCLHVHPELSAHLPV